uniref:F-box domain-containing protein n=1 Tax=Leersia perrieri TaxID=77586 RepID=A0A0D9X620_9ORYZ
MSSSSSPPTNAAAEADMLPSLPPEILNNILAWLPFKEVGRTCCLSHANYSAAAVSGMLARCAVHVEGFDVFVRRLFQRRALCWLRVLADKRVRAQPQLRIHP